MTWREERTLLGARNERTPKLVRKKAQPTRQIQPKSFRLRLARGEVT